MPRATQKRGDVEIASTTGLATRVAQSLGSTVAFDALRAGEIDLYVDYSGTIWATIMKAGAKPGSREDVLAAVSAYLRREHRIAVAGALGFENAYALAMRREHASRLGIRRISDLAPIAPSLTIGGDYEFFGRNEWRVVRDTYGIDFGGQRSMDSSLMYQAVSQGSVDVISAFSTDGRIESLDLVLLEDDRNAIPPYDAVILASSSLQARHPEVIDALRRLEGAIDAERMRLMNRAVDEAGKSPQSVARRFLAGRSESVQE